MGGAVRWEGNRAHVGGREPLALPGREPLPVHAHLEGGEAEVVAPVGDGALLGVEVGLARLNAHERRDRRRPVDGKAHGEVPLAVCALALHRVLREAACLVG